MLTDQTKTGITDFLTEHFPDVFVVDMRMNVGRNSVLSLRIDTEAGITMETLGQVNRRLGRWLDEQNVIETDYGMEISSPGVGEPLQLWRQYPGNVGRDMRIRLEDGSEVFGRLGEVSEDRIHLFPYPKKKLKKGQIRKPLAEPKIISFSHIQEAKIVV